MNVGVTGCWVAAGAVALTSRWIEREWGGIWVLPPDRRGTERADPGIAIPGDRGFVPQVQVVGSVGGVAGLRGAPERNPDRLRELVLMNAPEDGDQGDGTEPIGPAVSPATGDRRWLIGFSDVQGHDESDRIDRFVDQLSASTDVDRAHREDRDVVVVETALAPERLQALAAAAWAAADS